MQSESLTVRPTKKQRFSRWKKACVVCHAQRDRSDSDDEYSVDAFDEYRFYILDVGPSSVLDEYARIDPTIRLTGCPSTMTFCGLNNKLYMFDGVLKLAVKLEITREILDGSNYHLTMNDLLVAFPHRNLYKIKYMHHQKTFPVALPTPDKNHIIVFSPLIYSDGSGDTAFELYNIHLDSWEQLPGLPRSRLSFSIASYGFEGDSRFLVETKVGNEERMFFVLDLQAPVKSWNRMYRFAGAQHIPSACPYFLGIEDGSFCFTPHVAYDIRARHTGFSREFIFPLSSTTARAPPNHDYLTFVPDIALLGQDPGVYNSCVLRAEMTTHGQQECIGLILDVHTTDVDKYKKDKEANSDAVLKPTLLKSFKVFLDADDFMYSSSFYLISIDV